MQQFHTPEPAHEDTSAAAQRVTPEELARAIAAVEARRLDEARVLDGTIPIGEAVRELDLDATPEELLAEVRAQREARTPPPAAKETSPPPPPPAATVPPLHQSIGRALHQAAVAAAPGLRDAAVAAAPALQKGMDAVSQYAKQPKREKREKRIRRRRPWLVLGIFFAFVGISQGGLLHGHHSHITVQTFVPQMRRMFTIPDGREVYANTTTVVSIASGADPRTTTVQDGDRANNKWALIRHDNHWYVRGFVLRDAVLGTGPVKLYNDNDAGVLHDKSVTPVTLRLDTSPIADTNNGDDWSEIDMRQVQPDTHTHEDW